MTDKLRSYIKPIRALAPEADHRAHKGLNNRIEGSQRPTRKREKLMGRFKSPRQAQRFLAAHDQINVVFRPAAINSLPSHFATPGPTHSTSGKATLPK